MYKSCVIPSRTDIGFGYRHQARSETLEDTSSHLSRCLNNARLDINANVMPQHRKNLSLAWSCIHVMGDGAAKWRYRNQTGCSKLLC